MTSPDTQVRSAPFSFIRQSTSGTYLLILLFLVSTINFLDRQVLSIVQEDIKLDLTLTDSQLGYLGLAFGLINALFAIPIGRVADRIPRKTVLLACLTLWSSVTAMAGLVQNFTQLLITRMGVALGEAGVTPTTYSLISDKYPLRRRATAIAVCSAGIPVGIMFSLFLGGLIADTLGWRWTFVLFGLPGLILAAVFALTVRAPERGEADGVKEVQKSSFMKSAKHLLSTPTFVLVIVGSAFKSIASYGIVNWIPSFYIRKFELSASEVGMTLGPIMGTIGLISLVGAAYVADRLSERDVRWYTWIVAGSQFIAFPLTLLALTSGSYVVSMFFFALAIFCGNSMLAITNNLIQSTAPVHMRGMASATKTMVLSFVGYGLGGVLIGLLSDYFDTGVPGEGLTTALVVVSFTTLVSSLVFWVSSRTVKNDVEGAKAASLSPQH